MLMLALLLQAATPAGEEPVAPYAVSNANAGATPFAGDRVWTSFGGEAGTRRVVERFVELNLADPRIGDIFKGQDLVRLRRVLFEQFCYLLGGNCAYSGRDMKAAHTDLGIQQADMNALVDNLQRAMSAEGVPFTAQNRLLAKLAPMRSQVVER